MSTTMLNEAVCSFRPFFFFLSPFLFPKSLASSSFFCSLVVGLLYLGSGIAGTLHPPQRGRDIIAVVHLDHHDYACFTTPPSCHISPLSPFFFSLRSPSLCTCTSTNRLLSPAPAISIVLFVCIHPCVFPILSRVVVLLYMGLSLATTAGVSHHLYDFAVLSSDDCPFSTVKGSET